MTWSVHKIIKRLPFLTAEVVATGVVELEAVVDTEGVDIDETFEEVLIWTRFPCMSNIRALARLGCTCGDLVWTSLALVCSTRAVEVGIGAMRTGEVWPNFCFCIWPDGGTNLTSCSCKRENELKSDENTTVVNIYYVRLCLERWADATVAGLSFDLEKCLSISRCWCPLFLLT